jgi:hypothetical protein
LGRFFRVTGLVLLAAAAWLLIAGESGWLARPTTDAAFPVVSRAGAALLLLGLLAPLVAPVSRRMRQGRCVRCGASIERGQTYCMDHLRSTLDEAHDEIRNGPGSRAHRRA